jgi:NAD(P)-dependent dehydrogenase (short-subunit alcohol dehydrogenase family)
MGAPWHPGELPVAGAYRYRPPSIRPRHAKSFSKSQCPEAAGERESEIAEAALFLASPSAGFITGELMHVDGGYQRWGELWTAGRPAYFSFDKP